MNEPRQIKALVRLVAESLLHREPEAAVIEKLVNIGVPRGEAPALFQSVKTACQQGVLAVVTDGLSAPDGPPKDPLLAEAFRVGQASIRGATQKVWLIRLLIFIFVAATIGVIIWVLRR